MKNILIYTTALSSFWALSSWALSDYYQEAKIEIADQKETELDKTGSSVTLIDSQDIQKRSPQSIQESLATIPSAYVVNSGGLGQASSVSLRGLPNSQTKILLNGIDIADQSLIQPYYNLAYMPSSPLTRIEVVRGNQSTLYGSDAMGGVINMQSFLDKESQGAFATIGIRGGSYGTMQAYTRSGYNGAKGGISFYGDYLQTDGFSAAAEKNGNTEKDGYENITLGFNGWYDINSFWSLEGGVHYMDSKADYDGSQYDWTTGVSLPADADNFAESDENMMYLRLLGQDLLKGRLRTSLDISRAEINRSYDAEGYSGGRSLSDYNSEQYTGRWKGNFQVNPMLNMLLGAEYSYSSVDITTDYSSLDVDINETAIWGLATLEPTDNLYITLGSRWQNHEIFGDELTWRATLSYLLDQTQTRFHSSVGTGFRAPSLYELFDPTYGNKDLQPEESLSYDFGIEQQFLNRQIIMDVTAFYNEVDNKILYQSTSFYTGSYFNVSEEKSMGVEGSLKAQISNKLDIGASYAYVKAWNPMTDQDSLRQPRHRGTLSLTWVALDKLKLGADLRAYSSQLDYYNGNENIKLAGYGLVDLRAEYDINDKIKLKANIHNLLDKEYEPVFGYGSQGLSAYASLEARF